ncbi:MAG: hypothetical protein QGH42_03800 [Kiritimatiellia bacterium]|jgi:cellobiose phosphorylase|nr:hypothetical protein [Kiritimatiellia bacterium]MDP6810923.1 hypothetical protein [Kiritimatiellia bacterium]MDP7023359.1 hypothetical protein [Kiritimatiellia bacterium]
MDQYGYFDEAAREYVITQPATPTPWINYLMGKNLKAFVSNGAGGMLWHGEPNCGRMTRYRFNGLPMDSPGFYLYVRDGESVWNPSYYPRMVELDRYACRHGLGYTRFEAEKDGLAVTLTFTIPMADDVMLWDVTLTNHGETERDVTLTPYMELSLHDSDKDVSFFLVCGNQVRYTHNSELNAIASDYFAFESPFTGQGLFGSSEGFTSFELLRDRFIGRGRTEANPIGLESKLSCTEIPNGGPYACCAVENKLVLGAGESKRLFYKYAVSDNLEESTRLFQAYTSCDDLDRARQGIDDYWGKVLAAAQVETPDKAVNVLLNTWLPNNVRVAMRNARSISTRHTGTDAAMRYRDTLQDALSCSVLFPDEAREIIEKCMVSMCANGRTVLQINPVTLTGNDTGFTRIDAAVWGIFTVYQYLAETGDDALLDEVLPYFDEGEGTVLEHLIRSLAFISGHRGDTGLPQLFDVDWNDMLQVFSADYEGGETVMVAEQYILAARMLIEILETTKREGPVADLQASMQEFADALSADAVWDGAWFRRLLFTDEPPMGSAACDEAKIFLNAQSWAVLSGCLPEDRLRTAMDSVAEHLATPFGIRTFSPGFTKMNDGAPFRSNGPGAGENAGLFLHANTWAIMAECALGNRERAWQYFSQILPVNLSAAGPDRYANEPYAFTSWIYGPEHARYGTGQLSWLTGGASWLYKVGVEYILGIRNTLEGLRIMPCVPSDWDTYTVTRKVRGVVYRVTVNNPDHLAIGNIRLKVNGDDVEGDLVPFADEGPVVVEARVISDN